MPFEPRSRWGGLRPPVAPCLLRSPLLPPLKQRLGRAPFMQRCGVEPEVAGGEGHVKNLSVNDFGGQGTPPPLKPTHESRG
jgi:hypothetical protein